MMLGKSFRINTRHFLAFLYYIDRTIQSYNKITGDRDPTIELIQKLFCFFLVFSYDSECDKRHLAHWVPIASIDPVPPTLPCARRLSNSMMMRGSRNGLTVSSNEGMKIRRRALSGLTAKGDEVTGVERRRAVSELAVGTEYRL
jgi:hypothetical protein